MIAYGGGLPPITRGPACDQSQQEKETVYCRCGAWQESHAPGGSRFGTCPFYGPGTESSGAPDEC